MGECAWGCSTAGGLDGAVLPSATPSCLMTPMYARNEYKYSGEKLVVRQRD